MFQASYIKLYQSGELKSRISDLERRYHGCNICPHNCNVDRFEKSLGKCNTPALPVVSSIGPHFGEEPPLVGIHGSGTIFFTNCNLKCIFCQNYDISQLGHGQEISYQQLSDSMLHLQDRGCHNINFVTPTHQVYAILKALELAVPKGLSIPLVYNSGGYDRVTTLKILEDIFDIYMPDFKYFNSRSARKYSGVENYPLNAMKAIREMYRQVDSLITNSLGIAQRGLIVRHLVLPGYYNESRNIIDFISELSPKIYFNLMDQYRPEFKALEEPLLNTQLSSSEYQKLLDYATKKGLHLAK